MEAVSVHIAGNMPNYCLLIIYKQGFLTHTQNAKSAQQIGLMFHGLETDKKILFKILSLKK